MTSLGNLLHEVAIYDNASPPHVLSALYGFELA
jgi:hypothetical protein